MSVSAYLVPFPDPGAFDLMSDHLEQEVRPTGPGKLLVSVSLPTAFFDGSRTMDASGKCSPRKRLEFFKRDGTDWTLLWGATTDSEQAREEVCWDVATAETLKCSLTNMTGTEGQFSLDCKFIPLENA